MQKQKSLAGPLCILVITMLILLVGSSGSAEGTRILDYSNDLELFCHSIAEINRVPEQSDSGRIMKTESDYVTTASAGQWATPPKQPSKTGLIFDGWFFSPTQSGLTGSDFKWDFEAYPRLPYLSNLSLTYQSAIRIENAGLTPNWTLRRISGDATGIALNEFASTAEGNVRVEGEEIVLLRANHTGVDQYQLVCEAGDYSASCDITLTVVEGDELPASITLITDSYEAEIGEEIAQALKVQMKLEIRSMVVISSYIAFLQKARRSMISSAAMAMNVQQCESL